MSDVDRAVIQRLVDDLGGEAATVGEILAMFLQEGPANLADLRTAVGRKDLEVARRAAHTLKSTAAQFGAMAVSEKAKELEHMAREGRLPEARDLADLEALWSRAAADLQAEQQRLVA